MANPFLTIFVASLLGSVLMSGLVNVFQAKRERKQGRETGGRDNVAFWKKWTWFWVGVTVLYFVFLAMTANSST